MFRKVSNQGFSAVIVLVVVVVVAGLAFGGWYAWKKNRQNDTNKKAQDQTSQTNQGSNKQQNQPTDPSEGGKYLVIAEWGVRFALPAELQNAVSYSLGEPVVDPDGNQIQAAKLLLKNDPAAGNECAVIDLSQGAYIDSAAQLLRVEKDKPFNAQRYRWTFKENILRDSAHVYHLNYVTPGCANAVAVNHIEVLQGTVEKLQKVE